MNGSIMMSDRLHPTAFWAAINRCIASAVAHSALCTHMNIESAICLKYYRLRERQQDDNSNAGSLYMYKVHLTYCTTECIQYKIPDQSELSHVASRYVPDMPLK
jgi:hypothetical protein